MTSTKIITLSNFLRREGMNVSIRSSITASWFYENYNSEFQDDNLRQALECIYVKNKEDIPKFRQVYDQIFYEIKKSEKQKQEMKHKSKEDDILFEEEVSEEIKDQIQQEEYDENMQLIEDRQNRKTINDAITRESIIMLDNYDNRVFDICRRLSRKIANQRNKRRKKAKSHSINMPRTIRHNLKNGGHLINLLNQKPPLKKTKQVFLCDVSGSCQWISTWFFAILYGCYKTFDKISIFDFDNKAVDVTETFHHEFNNTYEINSAHQSLGLQAFGQSDMAKSFKDFLKNANLNKHTDIIILTDCRDWKGKRIEGVLESADLIRQMKIAARRVIILNPEKKIRWNTPTSCVQDYVNAGAEIFETSNLEQIADVISKL